LINFAAQVKVLKTDKKESILDSAEKLFATLGYDGASTRLIANEAGVNVAMLNYYFGSKKGVYKTVLERRYKGFHQDLFDLNKRDISSWDKLSQFIEMYSSRILSQHSFHKLIQREMSLRQRPETADFICSQMAQSAHEVCKILKEGIKNKSFKEVDPEFTVATIFGTNYYLIGIAPVASLLLEKDLTNQDIIDNEIKPRINKHLKDLLKAHLQP